MVTWTPKRLHTHILKHKHTNILKHKHKDPLKATSLSLNCNKSVCWSIFLQRQTSDRTTQFFCTSARQLRQRGTTVNRLRNQSTQLRVSELGDSIKRFFWCWGTAGQLIDIRCCKTYYLLLSYRGTRLLFFYKLKKYLFLAR